ncbi:hypothetical protein DMA11_01355 [Marinilabiliaceae bacterium JC017]|nr:hypothetical protein DMA11_01355 [Marinilabiliaceae bacterium JC017]
MKHLYTLLVISLLAFSCTSKRYVNKAQKLDDAGLYQEAADMYYKSLQANAKNIDAKLGLKRTGQLVLDDKIKSFKNLYNNSTDKDAVYAFLAAEKYYQQVAVFGIQLELPEENRAYFNEVKETYLDKQYAEAIKALNLEEFSPAEKLFHEILTIDANYKDSKTHWITAKYEPVYREGNDYLASNLNRSAYYNFERILKETGNYKNSLSLKEEALNKALITIAIVPFNYYSSNQKQAAAQLKAKIVNNVNHFKSPFFKVINDQVINSIPKHNLGSDPVTTVQWLKNNGANITAKTILTGRIVRFDRYDGDLVKEPKKGYIKHSYDVVDGKTGEVEHKTVYNKVKYYECKKHNHVQLNLEYSLVNIQTGEILLSDVINLETKDEINYAKFDGDYQQLVPGYWEYADKESESDQVYDDHQAVEQLRTLFRANKNIQSTYTLESEVFNQSSNQITHQIEAYNPEV